jgi:hypothetical protein
MNIFLYWVGKEYKLIYILRKLIYLHLKDSKDHEVILITEQNVKDYMNIPENFYKLCPANQADFVRVNVICDFGGIWLDSDTLVMDNLDSLFDILRKKDGFFIKENNVDICNGVFGSNKNTPLMLQWKKDITETLNKKYNITWSEIGSEVLSKMFNKTPNLYDNYTIFNGLDNIYPVVWYNCKKEFIDKPYDNYKNIIRNFQPLIILVNDVYKRLEEFSIQEILTGNMPINYFIKKSFENLNLIDYDINELGKSN